MFTLSKTICIFLLGFFSNEQKMKTFIVFAVIAGCMVFGDFVTPNYTKDENHAFEKFKVRHFILQRYEDL